MRVAPIGIVCAGDPKRAARLAEIDACISHAGDGVTGAQAIAASVAEAMVGSPVETIIAASRRFIPEDSWLGRRFDRAMAIVDDSGADLWQAWEALHRERWTPYRAANAEALPQAYALFRLTRGNFVDGIIAAGNFGRDADTLAALVGAWSGAMHGAGALPPAWIESACRPSGRCLRFAAELDIEEVARALAALIR